MSSLTSSARPTTRPDEPNEFLAAIFRCFTTSVETPAPPPAADAAVSTIKGGYRAGYFPIPSNEDERMRVLRALDVLDSSAEASFDHIADWGRRTFNVPICLVTLVDSNRQWFKACYGLDVNQTGRDAAFCAHAIMPGAPEIFEVPDACADTRFANNPLVVGAPHIRYYAGAPLHMDGTKLGTLCVIDKKPRAPLSKNERETLKSLAAMVCDQLTSRLQSKKLQVMYEELVQRTAEVIAHSLQHIAHQALTNPPLPSSLSSGQSHQPRAPDPHRHGERAHLCHRLRAESHRMEPEDLRDYIDRAERRGRADDQYPTRPVMPRDGLEPTPRSDRCLCGWG